MATLEIGIFKRAFSFPFRNFSALLRLALIPGLIALLLSYLIVSPIVSQIGSLTEEKDLQKFIDDFVRIGIVLRIIFGVVLVILAVGIHRLIVMGEYPNWVILRFGRYELAYAAMLLFFVMLYLAEQYLFLGVAWALGLIPAVLLSPFPSISDMQSLAEAQQQFMSPIVVILFIPYLLVVLWINVRLALTLAHAAVTGELSLTTSWEAMRGNFWRLIAAIILLALVAVLVYFVLGTIVTLVAGGLLVGFGEHAPQIAAPSPGPHGPLMLGFAFFALMMPVYGLLLAMFIALLSYAYKELV